MQLPPLPASALRAGANHFLALAGEAARVLAAARVCPRRFHARFSARQRTYVYRLHAAREPPALAQRAAVWHVKAPAGVDVGAMRAAAAALIGRNDFSAFRGAGCGASSSLRTLSRLDVHAAPPWRAHPSPPPWLPRDAWADAHTAATAPTTADAATSVVVTAAAPSFVYHQVRMMVGCLAAVGTGRLAPERVAELLAGRDSSRCPAMAPPHGLYLADVAYPPEALAPPSDDADGDASTASELLAGV